MTSGPGLSKARARAIVVVRHAALARCSDERWRALFAAADSVSEGSVREETGGAFWYGSTSLILQLEGGETSETREFLAAMAARDLHVRVRALRMACREATLRAPGPLGPKACEIRVASDSRGVRIDVDVQAPLIGGRATRPRLPQSRR